MDDDFQDGSWSDDGNDDEDDVAELEEKAPTISKGGAGGKTIFVTYQLRHFEDDYEVLGSIGDAGQFGVAYECYLKSDSYKQRKCVKTINKARFHHITTEARNEILQTMQNEIATLKKVDHPGIVKLYDVYEDRHKLHLVMEFLPGGELFERISEKESFGEKEAVTVLKQILEALDHMHDLNILHLDLKPDNILYATKAEDAPIKLIDFGMARVVPRLAKLKDRVGTPNYMAPEVLRGEYSKGADVWSCGIILFCMLFGFPPFYADEEDDGVLHLDVHQDLEDKIKNGFDASVKPGYGAWFPEDIPMSDNCMKLLSKMLCSDVTKRWTVKECLTSAWIRGYCTDKSIPPIVRDALKKFNNTTKFKVAISNLFRHQLDQDHIAEIKKFFEELDEDNDGAITLKEFKDGMHKTFETDLTDKQLEGIFKNVDLDGDQTISFNELLTITAHRMLVDEDERLFEAFNELDEDGDGLISREELKNAVNRSYLVGYIESDGNLMSINENNDDDYDEDAPIVKTISFAIGNSDSNSLNDDSNNNDARSKGHRRKPSKALLKRFQSAFDVIDKNNDGQIDYEEFLRILHPDFTDEMNMETFKTSTMTDNRMKGGKFDVDFKAAQTDKYSEVHATPKAKKAQPSSKVPFTKKNTLGFAAFKHAKPVASQPMLIGLGGGLGDVQHAKGGFNIGNSVGNLGNIGPMTDMGRAQSNTRDPKAEVIRRLRAENATLRQLNDKLNKRMEKQSNTIGNDVIEKLKDHTNTMNEFQEKWDETHKQQIASFEEKLSDKESKMHEKDVLIGSLNGMLDSRNKENDKIKKELEVTHKDLKNIERMLKHAIDSKMRSLNESQNEIQKLKRMMMQSQNINLSFKNKMKSVPTDETNISTKNGKKKLNTPNIKKARHMSIGDYFGFKAN